MTDAAPLRVVAWDDPRCVAPLEAAAAAWLAQTGERIEITRRPLTAFNDQPLAELSPLCDVMIIDYPHIAQAVAEGAIIPIHEIASAEAIATVAREAIGPAQDSFLINGKAAALASDAACQVAAFRPSILHRLGSETPTDWDAVFSLQDSHPGAVALPLYHTDAISCLLSLTAGQGAAPDGGDTMFGDLPTTEACLTLLARLAAGVDDACWDMTPQILYAAASKDDTVAYIPLTFGYTRLTKPEEGGWRFGAPPDGCGSLLGGAGMAVSSQSEKVEAATAFVAWYCAPEGQVLAGRNWGQPAGRAAWTDRDADETLGRFFTGTRTTQERAFVRPLSPWWPAVQTETGKALVSMLRSQAAPAAIVDTLNGIYRRHRNAAKREKAS